MDRLLAHLQSITGSLQAFIRRFYIAVFFWWIFTSFSNDSRKICLESGGPLGHTLKDVIYVDMG